MERCYEYFDCKQVECIVFQNKTEKPCWETERTLCCFHTLTPIIEDSNHKDNCNFCLYKLSVLGNK